jgi:SAM-dependent methyltransferase
VDPDEMFGDYTYHSSVSNTFKEHCKSLAVNLKENYYPKMGSNRPPCVLDIASNDGCLLEQFREVGFCVTGVEPAENLVEDSLGKFIPTINGFWSQSLANKFTGEFHFVTATNVLAHVDKVRDFICAVGKVLHPKGVFVVEVPYVANLLKESQFDTIYHEHLSYFSVKSLTIALRSCGIRPFHAEIVPIHGGSIRMYSSLYSYDITKELGELEEKEHYENLHMAESYMGLGERARKIRDDLIGLLERLREERKVVIGFGAPAKGVMLMNYCGLTTDLVDYIVDDTEDKQWRFIPGCGIPIYPRDKIGERIPDYIILFPWNFATELIDKTKYIGAKYIVPIPEVKVI